MPELVKEADFDLGRTALLEITTADAIGANAGSIETDDGVVTVYFDTNLAGYPSWRWTVSIAHVDGEAPSVLETELTPGDGALLSPPWIPWVDRLADYRAAQEALGADAAELDAPDDLDDDLDDDADDDDEEDDADEDDFNNDVLHGGDLDGVDIDESADGSAGDDSEDDDDDDDDDDPADDLDEDELASAPVPDLGIDDSDSTER